MKNSREIIKKYFNWDWVADETTKVYEDVIKKHKFVDCKFLSLETFLNPPILTISFFGFLNKATFFLYDLLN
jgi:hypothetical protein